MNQLHFILLSVSYLFFTYTYSVSIAFKQYLFFVYENQYNFCDILQYALFVEWILRWGSGTTSQN